MIEAISAANRAVKAISTTMGQQRPELTVSDTEDFEFKLMLQARPVPHALAARNASVPQSLWPKHERHPCGEESVLEIHLGPDFYVDAFLALCDHLRSEDVAGLVIIGPGAGVKTVWGTVTWLDLWEVLAYCWPNIKSFVLAELRMPPAAAQALGHSATEGKWAQLKELCLQSVQLGNARVMALVDGGATDWQQLQALDLYNNNIGSDGVYGLTEVASSWQQLKVLLLDQNPIANKIFWTMSSLAGAAAEWKQLERLGLQGTQVSKASVLDMTRKAAPHWSHLKVDLTCCR